MSVTDNQPTKVGQRVQEVFTDTRGWVRELGRHRGQDCAVVDWDQPVSELGEDDDVFPLTALRVVEVIQVDADHYADPGTSPLVEMVSMADSAPDLSHARYRWVGGGVSVGIATAREELLKRSTSA